MKDKKLVSAAIITTLALPMTAFASNDFFISKVFNKISVLTAQNNLQLEHIAYSPAPDSIPLTLKAEDNTSSIINTTTREDVIDTYSGIIIQFTDSKVSFNYLGEPDNAEKEITNADPQSFELLDTGTYIIASDTNALYIIYGDEQSRYPDIDLSSLKIVKNSQNEIDFLVDKNQSYTLDNTNLIPM